MEKESKLFGVRDINSFDKTFTQARLRLTFLYVGIFAVLLIISASVTQSLFASKIHLRLGSAQGFNRMRVLQMDKIPTPEEVKEDLFFVLLWVNVSLLVVGGGAGYILAGQTLKPIKKNVEKQQRFMSDASHELRTPLTILQLGLERDKKQTQNSSEQQKIDSHLEEVSRMSNLVSDLLVLARADEEIEDKKLESVNVVGVIDKVCSQLEKVAEQKKITLSLDKKNDQVFIDGREDLLFRVFQNIIKNAIVHNKEKGTVDVLLWQDKNIFYCSVIDNGPGIPDEHKTKIFERFTRVDKSRSQNTGGSGLGLAITRSIVEKYNGKILLQSKLGEGTKITVEFFIHKTS